MHCQLSSGAHVGVITVQAASDAVPAQDDGCDVVLVLPLQPRQPLIVDRVSRKLAQELRFHKLHDVLIWASSA